MYQLSWDPFDQGPIVLRPIHLWSTVASISGARQPPPPEAELPQDGGGLGGGQVLALRRRQGGVHGGRGDCLKIRLIDILPNKNCPHKESVQRFD